MSPTVRSGDRLLVAAGARRPARSARATSSWRGSRPGPELLVVKRVRRAVPGGHWVEGDNPLVTDDSRAFGTAVVVGRVVARLWPGRGGCPGRLPGPPRITLP